MCLFRFYLFLHVDELTVVVIELILQESEFLRGDHMDTKSIFHLPLALQTEDTLVDVGSHVGDLMVPLPKQVGQTSSTFTLMAGRTR